jgi:hypothetical protein
VQKETAVSSNKTQRNGNPPQQQKQRDPREGAKKETQQ